MSGAEQAITVSPAALDDAVQILRDKYDILLDRITDRLLDMPAPGTPQWYSIFRDAPSADTYRQRRTQIRAALAHRAQVNMAADVNVGRQIDRSTDYLVPQHISIADNIDCVNE